MSETLNIEAKKRKYGIIVQVAVLFFIGALTTGILTYICESYFYFENVKTQTEQNAAQIADEAQEAITEYPAYMWLIRYWYSHADEMDIEYDAIFDAESATAEKCRKFSEHNPGLDLRYLETPYCYALSPEDQKLYAEIAYSWLLTRIDQIKQSYNVPYLFCVISEEPYDNQFFVFSGAKRGAKRGVGADEAYILGKRVTVSDTQRIAMMEAILKSNHLADATTEAGTYADYYTSLCSFDRRSVLIGLSYDWTDLRANAKAQTRKGATLAIFNQMILSLICLGLIFLYVLRPLKWVQGHIRSYKKSKDSKTVIGGLSQIKAKNEIGDLADDVSEMISEIETHIEKIANITAEREHVNTEMSLAARIQLSMLPNEFPPFPDRTEFDIYASMDPAKQVGGDFYDFFMIDDDHLALVIADVSGKGVPAALMMVISKIIVKNYTTAELSPAKALEMVNHRITIHNHENMFFTIWLGVLEISTGILTAANAGHEYPVLKNPGGDFELVKDKHGLVVGAMDGIKYKEYKLKLEKGSKLFVYTDGVPEATDANNILFGNERMLEALNNEAPDETPEQILKGVRKSVNEFVKDAEQFDDLTMLCIEYKGKQQ